MKIFALTYEYSYANNNNGNQSPDEAGGIFDLYEDEDDARAEQKKQEDSGDWGVFRDTEENDGWSSGGYIIRVEEQKVISSSKRKG